MISAVASIEWSKAVMWPTAFPLPRPLRPAALVAPLAHVLDAVPARAEDQERAVEHGVDRQQVPRPGLEVGGGAGAGRRLARHGHGAAEVVVRDVGADAQPVGCLGDDPERGEGRPGGRRSLPPDGVLPEGQPGFSIARGTLGVASFAPARISLALA
jgi:hypothetical protein